MRIGLFGGTFDPPHDAHLGACLLAMRRLGLDRVWWLVTPGNPLKDTRHLAPLAERLAAARKLARHPRIEVSGLEAEIGSHYTYDTIKYLRTRCPGVRFVWIMGADNLRSFHRWNHWRRIAALVPIIVIDRLGPSLYASSGAAGQALGRFRKPEHKAARLADYDPPAWIFLHGLKSPLSSTALRAQRQSHYDHTSAREKAPEAANTKIARSGGKSQAGLSDGQGRAGPKRVRKPKAAGEPDETATPGAKRSRAERKLWRGVRDG